MADDSQSASTAGTWETTSDQLGAAFDLLCSRRRRYALEYLAASDEGAADVDELTAHVVEAVRARTETYGAEPPRAEVYTELYHAHLPRLTDAGLTAFDPSAGVVRLVTLPDPVDRCLDLVQEFDEQAPSN